MPRFENGQYHFLDLFDGNGMEDMIIDLPYSDLRRSIPDDDLIVKTLFYVPLMRLDRIRSLSFLAYVGPSPERMISMGYKHTRWSHVNGVALASSEIGLLNNLPHDSIRTLKMGGLLHDGATPALGEATKFVDPENLDEEVHWRDILDENAENFMRSQGIDVETLDDIINNRGMLSQILDIADRITYTTMDLENVIGDVSDKTKTDLYLMELRYPLSHDPKIGNIYRDVVVDQKKKLVFFSDPKRLGVFLLLRAMMHKNLYMNPTSMGRDLFVGNLLRPLYATDGSKILSPSGLRRMTDSDVLTVLAETYKFDRENPDWLYHHLTNWYSSFEKFENLEEAEKRANELKIEPDVAVLGIRVCNGFDTATSYKVLNSFGEIESFSDCEPEKARKIEKMSQETYGVYLFYADVSENTSINDLLRKVHGMPQSIATEDKIG